MSEPVEQTGTNWAVMDNMLNREHYSGGYMGDEGNHEDTEHKEGIIRIACSNINKNVWKKAHEEVADWFIHNCLDVLVLADADKPETNKFTH
jgi:hypothetical protein